jgi:hypothetical protein
LLNHLTHLGRQVKTFIVRNKNEEGIISLPNPGTWLPALKQITAEQ